MLRIVLLGGTGFVGRAILRRLEQLPRESVEVRALVPGDPKRVASPLVTPVAGELPTLPAGLFPEQPHVVVHFATRQIDRDGRGFEAVNVGGMRALVRALPAACAGAVYGSSLSVYGQGPQEWVIEDAPLAPGTDLARSRVRAERVLFGAAQARGLTAFALRPRFILGQGDRSTLPALLSLFRLGIRPGDGKQRFSVIDVDDYADVVVRLARRVLARQAGSCPVQQPLNVGYAAPLTLSDLHSALASRFGLPAVRLVLPVSSRATRLLSRLPSRPLRQLLAQLELIGLPHYADVRSLAAEIGEDVVAQDPRLALYRAVARLQEVSR